MATRKTRPPAAQPAGEPAQLYTLEVCIVGGPILDSFLKENPVVCRTIQIRGDQSLARLHRAIFKAFDREEEHMYEFQVGGKRPMDPKARRYVLPLDPDGDPATGEAAGVVDLTTVGALGLKLHDAFGYWFDFGDDWWHQVNVLAVDDEVGAGRYPRVTARVGKSPPQYADWDAEGGEA
jgi:hypothetical protein